MSDRSNSDASRTDPSELDRTPVESVLRRPVARRRFLQAAGGSAAGGFLMAGGLGAFVAGCSGDNGTRSATTGNNGSVTTLLPAGDAGTKQVALWSAGQLADAVRRKKVGSLELLDLYLGRIERYNPAVNAVVTLDIDRARAAAKAADHAVAKGERLGALHGVPITIKDAIEVGGVRSTSGAVELSHHVPARDAPAVARLKAAGAIVFGKTNTPKWAGDSETFNKLFGTTNNPWALDHTPGGSSGGPAAAVAAGLSGFDIGTDLGGSIRHPAAYCCIYGLKPSYGVISQLGFLDHVGGGLADVEMNVVGPLARSAADLDLLLSVLVGPDPERAPAWRVELPPPRRARLAEYRIGVWLDDADFAVETEYETILRAAVDRLANAGARIEETHPSVDLRDEFDLYLSMLAAVASWVTPPDLIAQAGGSYLQWLQRVDQRAKLQRRWADWFRTYDLLLCPVDCTSVFRHDQSGELWQKTFVINGKTRTHLEALAAWTGQANLNWLPAAAVPIGFTKAGLPVGMQVIAGYLRDREAIHAAQLVDGVLKAYRPPPGYV